MLFLSRAGLETLQGGFGKKAYVQNSPSHLQFESEKLGTSPPKCQRSEEEEEEEKLWKLTPLFF